MRNLMIRMQDGARAIRSLQEEVPKLKEQLFEAKGIFKDKEHKSLIGQIQQTKQKIDRRPDNLPDILREDGYPDVQAFMATYRKAEAVVFCPSTKLQVQNTLNQLYLQYLLYS